MHRPRQMNSSATRSRQQQSSRDLRRGAGGRLRDMARFGRRGCGGGGGGALTVTVCLPVPMHVSQVQSMTAPVTNVGYVTITVVAGFPRD